MISVQELNNIQLMIQFVYSIFIAVSFRLLGVQYYNDLNTPVTKKEAMVISDIVEKAVKAVLPGAIITLTGGFRRCLYKQFVCIV